MPDPADRLRRRQQILPVLKGLSEKAASEPMTAEEEQALAQMAVLSGATTHAEIRSFLQNLNNRVFSTFIQQAYQ
jgi:hypothetical protein